MTTTKNIQALEEAQGMIKYAGEQKRAIVKGISHWTDSTERHACILGHLLVNIDIRWDQLTEWTEAE